ncbi:MAG: HPr kinase/phosphatase C-terminal domain-containing protein [Pseudomonadota bacterium]
MKRSAQIPERFDLAEIARDTPKGPLCNPASAIRVQGRGLLILGLSGSGKSDLAWSMIALGAELIADDAVLVTPDGNSALLSAPATLPPWIEARGIGLIAAPVADATPLTVVVSLDHAEPCRLPPQRRFMAQTCDFPLILGRDIPSLGVKLWYYLLHGRADDPS